MNAFFRSFRAERIKWRRDWTLLAACLVPLTQVVLLLVIVWFSGDRVRILDTGFIAWYKINFIGWNLVFMPILTALASSLAWELEEKSRGWNHLMALPVSRGMHFLVKWAGLISLCLGSLLVLTLLLVCGGLILKLNVEDLTMGPLEFTLLLRFLGYSVVAMLPVASLHAWFPSRFPNLGSSLGMALCGSWLTFQLADMRRFICLSPWGLASQITNLSIRAQLPSWGMYGITLINALLLGMLGMLEFRRRDEIMNR